ncbi:hypothetical protein, partial [Archangium violaceum]|uniref:hypothetical protein n=1 Tax=Archangium violaceum TaxID=83451 RepID=UPI0005BAFF75
KEAIDLGIVIATDGEDEDAVEDAISGAFGIAKDAVQAAIAQQQVNVLDLGKALSENFNKACRDIGMDPKVVNQLAQEMGFAPGTYGLISASEYQAKIYQDNDDINGGHGWVVTRAADGEKVSHYANHAFINNGHLIYMYHPNYVNGFWVTDCPAY